MSCADIIKKISEIERERKLVKHRESRKIPYPFDNKLRLSFPDDPNLKKKLFLLFYSMSDLLTNNPNIGVILSSHHHHRVLYARVGGKQHLIKEISENGDYYSSNSSRLDWSDTHVASLYEGEILEIESIVDLNHARAYCPENTSVHWPSYQILDNFNINVLHLPNRDNITTLLSMINISIDLIPIISNYLYLVFF